MRIIIDADSCPRNVRAIIQKAARRVGCEALFIADRVLPDCKGPFITMITVEPGPDHADHRVVEEVTSRDLVITRDVILASRVVEKGQLPSMTGVGSSPRRIWPSGSPCGT